MKAREFTINVPINIKINGDGDPEIDMPSAEPEQEHGPDILCLLYTSPSPRDPH